MIVIFGRKFDIHSEVYQIYLNNYGWVVLFGRFTVENVTYVEIDNEKNKCMYSICLSSGGSPFTSAECELFSSEEEAQKEADRRNNQHHKYSLSIQQQRYQK